MKINHLSAGLFLGLLMAAPLAQAQAPTCNATVTKRTITVNENRESYWDLIFDVAAPGCDNSRGQFDFVVQLSTTGGGKETDAKTTEFSTEAGKRTAVRFSYQAKPGRDVKDVDGVFVRQCTCVKP
jgi:hypothetical protein